MSRHQWRNEWDLPNVRVDFRPFSFYAAIPVFGLGVLRAHAGHLFNRGVHFDKR